MIVHDPDDTGPLFAIVGAVSPTLLGYTKDNIVEELWHRPGLAPRDRGIVTLAVLIAEGTATAYPHYVRKALDNGLTPAELSELVTHLAFYASWANAFGATAAIRGIFEERGIPADALPRPDSPALPVGEVLPDEDGRLAYIADRVAPASPALAHFTNGLLYRRAWLRPDLAPRDRSLATVAALATLGQTFALPLYVGRALQHGITREAIGEMLAHVAFYGSWGNAIAAASAITELYKTL
jgi:4-carboxymuconolactone decarboxylase